MRYYFKHYNTSFLISIDQIADLDIRNKIGKALTAFFQGFVKTEENNVDLSFIFTDHIHSFLKDVDFVNVNGVKSGDNQIYYKDDELEFVINKDNPYRFVININPKETFKSSVRIFHKAFKNNIELQISTFYYRIFLLFTQLWNLNNNISYIHASCVDVNGGAILFSADSGVGKSALLMRLSLEKRFRFIGDDLTIISNKSYSYFQGRSLSVKPYHLDLFNFLKNKIRMSMSFFQRLQWWIVNDNRLVFHLSPFDIFKNISAKSKLKRVIHMCPHDKEYFEIKDISIQELSKISANLLMNEQFLAYYKFHSISSLPNTSIYSNNDFYFSAEKIFKSAFKAIPLKMVLVPSMSHPNDLYEFLSQEKCLD